MVKKSKIRNKATPTKKRKVPGFNRWGVKHAAKVPNGKGA